MKEKYHISEKTYYEKAYGGWLGKNIGGTLGEPMEGRMEILDLTFYPLKSDGPLPNDDLDLQLVWLHALEQYGARLTAQELGQEWLEHVFFPFDEYGYALTNLRRNLKPPVSGWFGNPFTDCMGSPIRSEIWAMVAPAAPAIAAQYAWQDAIVDHAGGEGVYGEMFFAAIESAAFIYSDVDQLLDIGLAMIPSDSRVSKAVKDLRTWHQEGKDWLESRALILEHHGNPNFTDAPQNIAFTILGWLYGTDFGDAILKAVNCGYDTDCTGATLGAILGIIGGRDSLPKKWSDPVGDRIAISAPIKGFPFPKDLDELTTRTMKAAKEVLAAWDAPVLITPTTNTSASQYPAFDIDHAYEGTLLDQLWNYTPWVETRSLPNGSKRDLSLELTIDYGEDGPSIGILQSKKIKFTLLNHTNETWEGKLSLGLPIGWYGSDAVKFRIEQGQSYEYEVSITSSAQAASAEQIILNVERYHDDAPWAQYAHSISLVAASHFTVWRGNDPVGHQLVSPTNRVAFEKIFEVLPDGPYKLKTVLSNPIERVVRIIADTSGAIKATLNGAVIFESVDETDLIPAYHRSSRSKLAEVNLPAGKNILELDLVKRGEPFDLYVLPVANNQNTSPGGSYYYTDILLVPEE